MVRCIISILTAGLLAAITTPATHAQPIGPDIVVADLPDILRTGRVGDITAYGLGTLSCNYGDAPASWIAGTNQHPAIAQNIYRLKDGRFEQIGQAWVKHGFWAMQGDYCFTDCAPVFGDHLGIHCSDPYASSLNAAQSNLSPRTQFNAATGYFPYPPDPAPAPDPIIGRRLQVHDADLDPALNAGALYFVEGHYLAADDIAAGNHTNSASYRPMTVSNPSGDVYDITLTGTTVREKSAILAWADTDPNVVTTNLDITGDGRMVLAARSTDLGGGWWHYEYALHNLNSDRSAGSFSVTLHPSTIVMNAGFHDVDYHSGEPFDPTDWGIVVGGGQVSWSTDDYGTNPDANALRWSTLYNFRFDANVPPVGNTLVTIGLFKPGTPTEVVVATVGPTSDPPDCNTNGIPDECDLDCGTPGGPCDVPGCGQSLDCDANAIPDECDPDCNNNGTPDACDIAQLTSPDCNGNGTPDECEIDQNSTAPGGPYFCTANCDPDCNNNGTPDDCELGPNDCNANGVPDECEIDQNSTAPGGPYFCTANCDPDCNNNGTPDDCELGPNDCNANGVPDPCEIDQNSTAPGGPDFCTANCDPDCNNNGTPDDCELGPNDCNANGVPDECEIDQNSTAPGGPYFCTANCDPDCNNNGAPDDCELGPNDCNFNGTPDECEIDQNSTAPGGPYFCTANCDPDCNNNGTPDGCDVSQRILLEGFVDVAALTAAGWALIDNSDLFGTSPWSQGQPTPFAAYQGPVDSYAKARSLRLLSGTTRLANDTISNWLITPEITLEDDVYVSFFTRTITGSAYPDRLQVRMSTAGPSTDVGTTATSVGDFTALLLDINPALDVGGYPEVWTQFEIGLSGMGSPTTGRIAFRYFVTDASSGGANGNYVGLDTVLIDKRDCNNNGMPDDCDISAGTSLDCNANAVPDDCEYPGCPGILLADMNCDGAKNGADIQLFVEALIVGAYTCQADVDQDGTLGMADVSAFVAALLGA